MNKISILILSALFTVSVSGQVRQPHSLYFMETIPQISQMNPAFQPRANGYVALPLNFNFDLDFNFAVRDLLQKSGNKWLNPLENHYDYDKLRKSIGNTAMKINFGADIDIIGFGARMGSGYFSFGISEHISSNLLLPSDLFKITEKGLPDETKFDFSSLLNTSVIGYMQIRVGYSGKVNDKLSIGVNIKPMFGHVAIAPKTQNFKLKTGELWDLDAKGTVYSSAPVDVTKNDENKIDKFSDMEFRDFSNYKPGDWINNYFLDFNNPGIALDIGAAYQINERFSVSASLNNLGFIAWNNDLNSISFGGKYSFGGVDWDIIATEADEIKELFKSLGDSIVNAMDYSMKNDKFKTMLTPVFNAGASYKLTESVSLGFLSSTAFGKNGVRQNFNASVYLQPYSFVAMNAGINYQIKNFIHLSGGFTIFGGPLQFYLLVDNIPIYYSTLTVDGEKYMISDKSSIPVPFPERLKTFTLRMGVNLVFGKHGYINKPMLDKGKSSWN